MTVPSDAIDVRYTISAEATDVPGMSLILQIMNTASTPEIREAMNVAATAAMDYIAGLYPDHTHTIFREWRITRRDSDTLPYP